MFQEDNLKKKMKRKRNVIGFHEMFDLLGICFLKKEYNIIFCKSPELQEGLNGVVSYTIIG